MDLAQKTVVITGGAGGLGRALAQQLKAQGAVVFICDRDREALDKTVQELGVCGLLADVTDEAQLKEVASAVVEQKGRIDLWVNNAGVWLARRKLEQEDRARAARLFDIDYWGVFNGMRAALEVMRAQNFGTVINICSTDAFDGMKGSSSAIYASCKAAARTLTLSVAEDLRDEGCAVTCIAVCPSGIQTSLFAREAPENMAKFMTVDEVADQIIENLKQQHPQLEQILTR